MFLTVYGCVVTVNCHDLLVYHMINLVIDVFS